MSKLFEIEISKKIGEPLSPQLKIVGTNYIAFESEFIQIK
jgi:hypothetical protein